MTAVGLALTLANNVPTIARHQAAGQIYTDIRYTIDTIERTINRPPPPRLLGPCPTPVDHGHDKRCQETHPHPCGIALTAKLGDIETTCPACRTVHNIDRLISQQIDAARDESFTLAVLHKSILPAWDLFVPLRTLQDWVARSKLVPTGYEADGQPRFMLADVRALRDAKPQKVATGAAAPKRRAG